MKKRKRSDDEVLDGRGVQHHQHQTDSGNKDKHHETIKNIQLVEGGKGKGIDRIVKRGRVEKSKNKKAPENKTVIFVPQTANSLLAKMLRLEEVHLEKVTGYRVKYVEKSGQNIGHLQVRSNPWSGMNCGRRGCMLCETKAKTGQNLTQNGSKRNLTYQPWCNSCKEMDEDGK